MTTPQDASLRSEKRQTCQFGMYFGPRCRKRATLAIQYLQPWGERLNSNGSEPVYLRKVAFRCPSHSDIARTEATIDISDYLTALADAPAR